jgi:hypothetical protein
VTSEGWPLAAWCIVVSVITAACIWLFLGTPDQRSTTAWRLTSHRHAPHE